MESARLEVREMVHALVQLIPTNAKPPEDKPYDIETLKTTDAKLLPATLLSYETDDKETDAWDDAILSQYDPNYMDDREDIKNYTSILDPYEGVGEGILV